jgi:hypothetical protein
MPPCSPSPDLEETGYVMTLFPGLGVAEYLPALRPHLAGTVWLRPLAGPDPIALAMLIGLLADETAFEEFAGRGVWRFNSVYG